MSKVLNLFANSLQYRDLILTQTARTSNQRWVTPTSFPTNQLRNWQSKKLNSLNYLTPRGINFISNLKWNLAQTNSFNHWKIVRVSLKSHSFLPWNWASCSFQIKSNHHVNLLRKIPSSTPKRAQMKTVSKTRDWNSRKNFKTFKCRLCDSNKAKTFSKCI
jgi:hypothetical protein